MSEYTTRQILDMIAYPSRYRHRPRRAPWLCGGQPDSAVLAELELSLLGDLQPSEIVIVLKETMCLMEEIDDLIPSWPIE